MARVSYTALRSLKAGVTSGNAIDFDFDVSATDRETKVERKDQVAFSGLQETSKERTEELWRVTTIPVLEADFDDFRQFLDSCDGGEIFTFDPYGTLASPVAVKTNCVLDSKGYKEKRVSQRYLSVSFRIRVLP